MWPKDPAEGPTLRPYRHPVCYGCCGDDALFLARRLGRDGIVSDLYRCGAGAPSLRFPCPLFPHLSLQLEPLRAADPEARTCDAEWMI